MKTAYKPYSPADNSKETSWPEVILVVTLAFAVTLVFGANQQVIELAFGRTFEFVAFAVGLLAIAIGALFGARFQRLKERTLLFSIISLIALQALTYYSLNDVFNHKAFIASPFILIASIAGALFAIRLNPNRLSIGALTALEFVLAVVAGVGIAVLALSLGEQPLEGPTLGAPVLLFIAAGALLSIITLANPSAKEAKLKAKLRITWLSLLGVVALGVIAQVLLVREEQQTLDRSSHQVQASPNKNKLLWTFGARPLNDAIQSSETNQTTDGTFTLLSTLFQDSISVLMVDGVSGQLEAITKLNCADVTLLNESPLKTFLTKSTVTESYLADMNHTFTARTNVAFDFIENAQRRWDVIHLEDISGARKIDPLQPVISETQEFFGALLTHLSDSGLIVFEIDESPNQLALFRRLTAAASALRSRGIEDPTLCFATALSSDNSVVILISNQTLPISTKEALATDIAPPMTQSASAQDTYTDGELRACFQPGIEAALSDQYDADLSHLTLARPFPRVLPPLQFSLTPPVYAVSINGAPQADVSAIYDVLSTPVATLGHHTDIAIIAAVLAIGLIFVWAIALGRKALNHTVRDTRRHQRKVLLLFSVGLCGFLLIIIPSLIEESLRLGTLDYFPAHIRATVLLTAFGIGVWLSARKQHRNSYRVEAFLTLALLLAFAPIVLTDSSYNSVAAADSTTGHLLLILAFAVSPALFGAVCGLFLNREDLFKSSRVTLLLTTLLLVGISAMIFARVSAATFGFTPTMEIGLLLLGLSLLLQIPRTLKTHRNAHA